MNACSECLFANHYGGRNLTLLLEGCDEYPEHLRESSLLADILQRQVLPLCGLIVSSRLHASEHLWQQATISVDIYTDVIDTDRHLHLYAVILLEMQ